jgi:nucleoside-diphosphate-sugar epimerase
VVAKFLKHILQGEHIPIYGAGSQTRDFIHARDVARAIYLTLTTGLSNKCELFHIATGKETTINALYTVIREEMELRGYEVAEPRYEDPLDGEMYRNYADIRKATTLLAYTPSVSLNEGIKDTVEWFVQQKSTRL